MKFSDLPTVCWAFFIRFSFTMIKNNIYIYIYIKNKEYNCDIKYKNSGMTNTFYFFGFDLI